MKPPKIWANILSMKKWIEAIKWKTVLPQLGVVVAFGLFSLLFYYPLLQGKVLMQSDIQQYEGMARQLKDFRQQTGRETYWIDNAFGGMPTYQLGAQYPLDFLAPFYQLTRILPRPAHLLFLYLLCSYLLLLVLRVPWRVALLGAVGFGLSTYLLIILQVGHNTKAEAIAYMPLVLAGFFMVLKRHPLGGWLLTILALGLQIRANHYQMTYYLLMLLGVLTLFYGWSAVQKKQFFPFLKKLGVLASAGLLALGLNATPLLATAEYSQYSTRGPSELRFEPDGTPKPQTSGLDYDYITQYSYGIFESLNLLVPRLQGGGSREDLGTDSEFYAFLIQQGVPRSQAQEFVSAVPTYWGDQPILEAPAYIGISIVFLAFLALFTLKGIKKKALLVAILLSLILSWGKNLPAITQFFIDYVPLYSKFRAVSSIQVILELCFPILAALGVAQWIKNPEQLSLKKGIQAAVIFVGGLLVLYASKGLLSFQGPIDELLEQAYGPVFLDQIIAARKTIFTEDLLRALAFSIGLSALLYAYTLKKLKPAVLVNLLLLVVLVDLGSMAERYTDRERFVSKRQQQNLWIATQADQTILQDSTRFRVYEPDLRLSGARTAYFHRAIGGYHGAKLRRFQEAYDYFVTHQIEGFLDMLNTKYVLFAEANEAPKALINPQALGPAWTIDSLVQAATPDEALEALKTLDFSRQASIAQEDFDRLTQKTFQKDSLAQIKLVQQQPNELVYAFDSPSDQFVAFSEIYYPKGWQAYIDEIPVDHYAVNYILRGLEVPKGTHTLHFRFRPSFITTGTTLRITCMLFIVVFVGGYLFYSNKKNKRWA